MFILVDRARMGFCYRHPSMSTLFNLAHIELSESPVLVFQEEDFAGELLSDLELKLLYRNTTDGEITPDMGRLTLVRALKDVLEKLPICDANSDETVAQAACISDQDEDVYLYVKGSNKPRVQPDEFRPPLLKAGDVAIRAAAVLANDRRQSAKPAVTGGVKQHIRNMFAKSPRNTMEALTSNGQFSVSSIKTALSDLKNEKYAGGEILLTIRQKIDGLDYYVKD